MYKVGHSSAVPRSTLVYNGRRNLPTRSGICERTLNQYGAHSEKPCRNEMNMQIPALSRRIRTRMSSDATKCINMETVSVLMKDFAPFDVEGYLTERFLRDVNLDPKILSGFYK
ncbi:unnamed protein product [Wuchereria bancrofti]|uniref:Uncharacterized protein n=1 Tax=Wuchereria bancrofti TaxID=6293 RepID=A0A3P7EVI8_WUCBA|nr:unnamed protein product [Wuchereria bancrofti]